MPARSQPASPTVKPATVAIPRPEPGHPWALVHRLGAICAASVVGLVIVQVVIFMVWRPIDDVDGVLALFEQSVIRGLVNMDVLYLISNILVVPMYVALAVSLWSSDRALVVLASVAAAIGVAAYIPSNTAVEMLTVVGHHTAAEGAVQAVASRAAAETLLAIWQGTAFVTYYILSGVALIAYAAAMWRGGPFNRQTAAWGLVAGVLMCVPSVFGTIGLIFAMISLIPWTVFSARVARTLWAASGWKQVQADPGC